MKGEAIMMNDLGKVESIETLERLAGQIARNHTAAQAIAVQEGMLDCAVMEALLAGHKLVEAKTILDCGELKQWLAERCPELDFQTATRYMALANLACTTEVDDTASLREACLEAGIFAKTAIPGMRNNIPGLDSIAERPEEILGEHWKN